jgi:hypothetical protein
MLNDEVRATLQKGIQAVRSAGGTSCLGCQEEIRRGAPVIRVSVDVPVVISTVTVKKELHPDCALEMKKVIEDRLHEVYRM